VIVVLKKVFKGLFDITVRKFKGFLAIPFLIHQGKQRRLSITGYIDLAAGIEYAGLSRQNELIGDLVGGGIVQWLIPGITGIVGGGVNKKQIGRSAGLIVGYPAQAPSWL
jgi:hypothetical protein